MYCKTAKKECPYLEQVERLRQDGLIGQASSDSVVAEQGKRIEAVTTEYFEGQLHCKPEFCVVVAQAVRNSLINTALAKYDV